MTQKTDKKKVAVTAVVFRNIFFGLFALLLILATALATFGINKLQETADEVRAVVNEAEAIDQTNTRTVALWDRLQDNQQAAEKARQVVADSKSYAYQDVIVRDLRNFASKAGITIVNYDFTIDSSNQPAPPANSAPDGASEAAPGETADGASSSPLKTTTASITVETPVNYERLMTFIHYIEQNLTKMQISKVSLSRAVGEKSGSVNSNALIIEVYVR